MGLKNSEQKNRELVRVGGAAFVKEVKKEDPEFVKDCRKRYLESEIDYQSMMVKAIYWGYEEQRKDDVPYWFRMFCLEHKKVKEREKKLGWLRSELRGLESGKEPEITEGMVEQARRYDITKLVKAGKNNMAHSPFREDKHPSFYIKNNFYYDFATGESGDVIDLYMRLNNASFPEAIKALQ